MIEIYVDIYMVKCAIYFVLIESFRVSGLFVPFCS
jgi:hypothetical protein